MPPHAVPSSSPSSDSAWPAAARPSLTPRWKLAKRSRVAAADLDGVVAGDDPATEPAAPGTRFACGTRFGSPADVTPLDDGALTAWAARQPSSAGEEAHPLLCSGSCSVIVGLPPARPRRNQSASTASNIGSRCSAPLPLAGGTITPPKVKPASAVAGAPRTGCEAVTDESDPLPPTGSDPLPKSKAAGEAAVGKAAVGLSDSGISALGAASGSASCPVAGGSCGDGPVTNDRGPVTRGGG